MQQMQVQEKNVKKPVVSAKDAEKSKTISVAEEKKKTVKGSVQINEELPCISSLKFTCKLLDYFAML